MWLERIIKPLRKKDILFSSCIRSVLTVLLCSALWQGRSSAAAEPEPLDPTSILLYESLTGNTHQTQKAADQNDTTTIPDTELNVSQPPQALPRTFLLDAKPLLFDNSNLQTAFETESRIIPDSPPSAAKNELLKTSMSSLSPASDSKNKRLLSSLIEQITSLKIKPKTKQAEQPSGPQIKDKSKELKTDVNEPTEPAATIPSPTQKQQDDDPQQSTKTLNPEIVKKLEHIIEQSGRTSEPQLLADMLYQTGYYELAAYFYELAISRDTQTNVDDTDIAWLMMQKAVCLTDSNPQQAFQICQNLVSQYPDSPWVELAKTQQSLIDWLQTQQPEKLIESCRKDIKQNHN